MVFVLDGSLSSLFGNGLATTDDVRAIDYLAMANAEGNHRIVGSRRDLNAIASHPSIQDRTRAVLHRALTRAGLEGALPFRLPVYAQVVATGPNSPRSQNVGSQRQIVFPLRWFDSSERIQKTTLLGENLVDAEVLNCFGRAGISFLNLGFLPCTFSNDHGGGGTTGKILQSHADQQKICLCVVDSDRIIPGGALGGTATGVQKFRNEQSFPLIGVAETVGRDLENSLPIQFYTSKYGRHRDYGPLSKALAKLAEQGELRIRDHLDIENGLSLKSVLSLQAGTPERTFWDDAVQKLCAMQGIDPTNFSCFATGTCAPTAPTTWCTCTVIRGNKSDILEEFKAGYSKYRSVDWPAALDSSVRPEWERLGPIVASWGIGDEVLRA